MKHPHADILAIMINDSAKKAECKIFDEWIVVTIGQIAEDKGGKYEFRLSPRKFEVNHWYPCAIKGMVSVNMWDGEMFLSESPEGDIFDETDFDVIGKSMGKAIFGDEE